MSGPDYLCVAIHFGKLGNNCAIYEHCGCCSVCVLMMGNWICGVNKSEFSNKSCKKGSTLAYPKLFQYLPEQITTLAADGGDPFVLSHGHKALTTAENLQMKRYQTAQKVVPSRMERRADSSAGSHILTSNIIQLCLPTSLRKSSGCIPWQHCIFIDILLCIWP